MRKLKISFHQLLSKINRSGNAPVYCTISLSSAQKPVKLSTDIWLEKRDWDKKQRKVKSRHPRYIALNLEISAMEQKLYSIYDDLKKTHEFPSLEMIKHVFRNRTGIKKTLLSVFNDLIQNKEQRLGIEYAKGTIKNYISTKNRLKKFLKDVDMSTDIEISKLNEEFYVLI